MKSIFTRCSALSTKSILWHFVCSKEARMRHNSTSSAVSVDQGYISASPSATEVSPYMFSPPSTHARSVFSFHGSNPYSNGFHAPSTSPLPEVPDDFNPPLTSHTAPSPISPDIPLSGVFSPPLSPADPSTSAKSLDLRELQRVLPMTGTRRSRACTESDIQAMSQLIDHLWRNGRQSTSSAVDGNSAASPCIPFSPSYVGDSSSAVQHGGLPQQAAAYSGLRSLPIPTHQQGSRTPPYSSVFQYQEPQSFPPRVDAHYSGYGGGQAAEHLSKVLASSYRRDGFMGAEHILRNKDLKEAEKRELNKYILSRMSAEESKPQVCSTDSVYLMFTLFRLRFTRERSR